MNRFTKKLLQWLLSVAVLGVGVGIFFWLFTFGGSIVAVGLSIYLVVISMVFIVVTVCRRGWATIGRVALRSIPYAIFCVLIFWGFEIMILASKQINFPMRLSGQAYEHVKLNFGMILVTLCVLGTAWFLYRDIRRVILRRRGNMK